MNKLNHFLLLIIFSTSTTVFAQSSEVNPKSNDIDMSAINIVSYNELSAALEIGGESIRVSGHRIVRIMRIAGLVPDSALPPVYRNEFGSNLCQ